MRSLLIVSAVAHHLVNQNNIRFVYQICSTELTLPLGGHLRQDVAFERMFAFVASRCLFEAL